MTVVERTVVVQESIMVNAHVDAVWGVFSDLEGWPGLNPACKKARWLSGQPWAMGSLFELALKPSWMTLRFKAEIVESEAPRQVVWLGRGSGVYGQHTFTFETEGEGTRVTTLEVFSGPMLWSMVLTTPSGSVRRMFRTWLAALKAEAEKSP